MAPPPLVIAPSILSADFTRLGEDIESVLVAGTEWLHFDIMDGHFVPNLSFGACVAQSIRKRFPKTLLDCHLMVTKPGEFLEPLKGLADQITFHWEAVEGAAAESLLKEIRRLGAKASISVKPNTPVEALKPVLDAGLADNVLIMTVEPGFGGQKFMAGMLPKVQWLRDRYPELSIQVDGGVDAKSIGACRRAGANAFVAGSAVFGNPDRTSAIRDLHKALTDDPASSS